MQRAKAVRVIKELGSSCRMLNPAEIDLQEAKPKHFEIRIRCHVDDESWECLKELAKRQALGIKQTDHTLIIYAPVRKDFGKLRLS